MRQSLGQKVFVEQHMLIVVRQSGCVMQQNPLAIP